MKSQPKAGKKEASTSATFESKMKVFVNDIEELYGVFCNDQKQLRKLEESHQLRINKNDFAFY